MKRAIYIRWYKWRILRIERAINEMQSARPRKNTTLLEWKLLSYHKTLVRLLKERSASNV